MSRRDFVRSTTALAAAGLGEAAFGQDSQPRNPPPAVLAAPSAPPAGPRATPLLVGSANALHPCTLAFEEIQRGADPLDAVVKGINLVEDDPSDHSVGYGGLPNEDGIVQLDSCVMDGRVHKAGGVACLERIKNPSSVALQVMRRSDHVLLVGEGALRFARAHGFQEENLLTDEAREMWLKWKETHSDKDNWLPPANMDKDGARLMSREGIEYTTGTITCMALTASGDLVGCTSTSGLSWKLPGRVGDSPIIGAGLYVDNEVGACGSTGRGEANLQNCSSFLVVELMRGGRTPTEACTEVLRRIAGRVEKRLRNPKGEPAFGLTFYAIRKDGLVGGANLRNDTKMTYHDGKACGHMPVGGLFKD